MKKALGLVLACLAMAGASLHATDWSEFRGEGRRGVWNETGIIDTFPADGLPVLWRTPIKAGFSGPAVANGQVFVTDFDPIEPGEAPRRGRLGRLHRRMGAPRRSLGEP